MTDQITYTPVAHADIQLGDVVYIDNFEDGKFPKASPRISGPFRKVVGNGTGRCFERLDNGRGLMHYRENMIKRN